MPFSSPVSPHFCALPHPHGLRAVEGGGSAELGGLIAAIGAVLDAIAQCTGPHAAVDIPRALDLGGGRRGQGREAKEEREQRDEERTRAMCNSKHHKVHLPSSVQSWPMSWTGPCKSFAPSLPRQALRVARTPSPLPLSPLRKAAFPFPRCQRECSPGLRPHCCSCRRRTWSGPHPTHQCSPCCRRTQRRRAGRRGHRGRE